MTIKRLPKRRRAGLLIIFGSLSLLIIAAITISLLTMEDAHVTEPSQVKVALPAYDTIYTDEEIVWLAERADLLIMHESLTSQLPIARQANPDIIILKYKFSGMTNESRIGHSASGFKEVFASHQDWFLKDRNGDLVTDSYDEFSSTHSFYMDPAHMGWQQYSAEDHLSGLEGWDGVFMDVINVEIGEITQKGLMRYRDDASFRDATIQYLTAIHKEFQEEGKLLFINGATLPYQDYDAWSLFLPVVDGIADESFASRSHWGGGHQPEERWERQVGSMELADTLGKYFIAIAHDSGASNDRRYNLGSYLLASGGKSFFYDMEYPRFRIQGFKETFNEHEYMNMLGEPTGPRYEISGVWAREFENGIVLVNPGDDMRTVQLPGRYSENPSGLSKHAFTVQPKDALFLYRFS